MFDIVLKNGCTCRVLWESIDQSKLKHGILEFIKDFESVCDEDATLTAKTPPDFPSLHQLGIPMVKTCIKPMLRDIYSLNQATAIGTDLLTFLIRLLIPLLKYHQIVISDYNDYIIQRNVSLIFVSKCFF